MDSNPATPAGGYDVMHAGFGSQADAIRARQQQRQFHGGAVVSHPQQTPSPPPQPMEDGRESADLQTFSSAVSQSLELDFQATVK